MKAERIHHHQTYIKINVKESPSDRRKIIPDGNMDLSKGNDIYIGKYINVLISI